MPNAGVESLVLPFDPRRHLSLPRTDLGHNRDGLRQKMKVVCVYIGDTEVATMRET